MRKFTNINQVTIVKHLITGYQIGLTGLFIFGFMRVLIGLIMGEFSNISFGLYY